MTDKQKFHFYFPAWNRAFRAQWIHAKGRVCPAPDRVECTIRERHDTPLINYTATVEARATARALQAHRTATADDLRHACHIVALGQDKSSAHLTNAELERVVHLFKLLADPEDLDAIMAWFNPQNDVRRRLLWFLDHKVKRPYLESICLSEYDTRDYHSLTTDCLHNLVRTLKHRPGGASVPASRPQPNPDHEPF